MRVVVPARRGDPVLAGMLVSRQQHADLQRVHGPLGARGRQHLRDAHRNAAAVPDPRRRRGGSRGPGRAAAQLHADLHPRPPEARDRHGPAPRRLVPARERRPGHRLPALAGGGAGGQRRLDDPAGQRGGRRVPHLELHAQHRRRPVVLRRHRARGRHRRSGRLRSPPRRARGCWPWPRAPRGR